MATKRQKIGPWQDAWLRTLESGEFKQGASTLCRRINNDERFDYEHCCLGVFAEVLIANGVDVAVVHEGPIITLNGRPYVLARDDWERLCLHTDCGTIVATRLPKDLQDKCIDEVGQRSALTEMNDSGEWTFKQIAAFIRKYPEAVFSGPA